MKLEWNKYSQCIVLFYSFITIQLHDSLRVGNYANRVSFSWNLFFSLFLNIVPHHKKMYTWQFIKCWWNLNETFAETALRTHGWSGTEQTQLIHEQHPASSKQAAIACRPCSLDHPYACNTVVCAEATPKGWWFGGYACSHAQIANAFMDTVQKQI